MKLVKTNFNPFTGLIRMPELLDWNWPEKFAGDFAAASYPALTVDETETKLIVKAELPGMSSKDINITVENNVLTLSGEKKEETHDGKRHLHETYYGSFCKSIGLPVEVDAEKVEANYRNGVLEIVLEKSARQKSRKIEVKGE